jgi:4-carboxymuconolactone decarboxylase
MKLSRGVLSCLPLIAAVSAMAYAQQSAGRPPATTTEQLPSDIDPVTRNRLPPINPEELDDYRKQLIAKVAAEGRVVTEAGGPSSIRVYSIHVFEPMDAVNYYLRKDAGFEPRIVELAILVAARAMDSRYEWNSHEKAALKAGLSQEIVDVVKFRKPIAGMNEKDAAIVQLGREALSDRKVSSETFARALKIFGRQGLVNLVSLMADYCATAMLLTTFDQHLPAGQPSTLPVP